MKARKKTELEGSRGRAPARRRGDGAVSRLVRREAPRGSLTEIVAAQALETFRRETGAEGPVLPLDRRLGPNSAIPHYRVSEASNLKIGRGIFLIDSGGQYEDGTTDITRTIAVGRPSAEMRDRFTRVLKGHIAIARAVFPQARAARRSNARTRRALARRASISTMARDMASALICPSTKARSASPRPERPRSRPG